MESHIIHFSSKFGFAEYYEWDYDHRILPYTLKIGRFVEFNKYTSDRIMLAKTPENIIGVTANSSNFISDYHEEWPYKYVKDQFGKILSTTKEIARGQLEHDAELDIDYIKTFKDTNYELMINPTFDKNQIYNNRSFREEWQPIVLIGKCIVQDFGTCKPGEYCTLYNGNDPNMVGSAIPYKEGSNIKYYVLKRISKETILILFK